MAKKSAVEKNNRRKRIVALRGARRAEGSHHRGVLEQVAGGDARRVAGAQVSPSGGLRNLGIWVKIPMCRFVMSAPMRHPFLSLRSRRNHCRHAGSIAC